MESGERVTEQTYKVLLATRRDSYIRYTVKIEIVGYAFHGEAQLMVQHSIGATLGGSIAH